MSAPRISVALAACNGERHIEAQLESLALQTRLPDELVVCDDASNDGTREKVRAFAAGAAFPVRLEEQADRLGITDNFASALARTSGDIVFFADQDDIWKPQKIERLAGRLEADSKLGAVFSNGRVVDADGQPLGFDLWESLAFSAAEQTLVAKGRAVDVFLKHVVAAGTTMAFRGSFRELALPFPALRSCHDAWLAFLAACVSNVEAVDEPLIDYRLHGDNQIGIRKLRFFGQLEKAKEQVESDAFGYAVAFFEQARERLQSPAAGAFDVAPDALTGIEAKVEHARRRASMSGSLLRRLPDIAREMVGGRYGRYSYGARSIAQDVFLR